MVGGFIAGRVAGPAAPDAVGTCPTGPVVRARVRRGACPWWGWGQVKRDLSPLPVKRFKVRTPPLV